jgi:hypothetical protein
MKLNGVTKLRKNEIRKATKGRNTKERNLSVRRQGAKPTGRQVSHLRIFRTCLPAATVWTHL